jgi:hypothetical protein
VKKEKPPAITLTAYQSANLHSALVITAIHFPAPYENSEKGGDK